MRWAQACMASAILAVAACGDDPVPFCDSQPCQNGATCAEGETGPVCACAPGYEGAVCQTNIDECASMPCQNGGTCTDGVDAFTCACPTGFEGPTCATNTDDCAPNPCLNGGACTDGVDAFTCACAAAFEGDRCQCALTGPFTLDYTNRGTSTTAMITDSPLGVTVTGSGTIQIVNLNGLGVVGGASNNTVDGSEQLEVALTSPASAVSYFVSSASNLDGDGLVGEATIEAFDATGASLGVRATADGGVKDVTGLFAGARVKRFVARANVDGFRVATITVSPVVCP